MSTELLTHPDNLFNRLSGLGVDSPGLPSEVRRGRGRPVGKTIPLTEQILIGVAANVVGASQAARDYDVATETAHGYKRGTTEQGKKNAKPHPELKPALDAALKRTGDMVAERILGSIAAIEIKDGKVRGLDPDKPMNSAALANTLAGVHEKLSGAGKSHDNRVQIVVYGPSERPESYYDSIEVSATSEEQR